MTPQINEAVWWIGAVTCTYLMIGMFLFVFARRAMVLNIQLSQHLPERQCAFVIQSMLLWPATYWIRRHYRYHLERQLCRKDQHELRALIQQASNSAVQGN